MTGRPKLKAFCKKIEGMGGDAVILDMVAEGELSIAKIAAKFDASRGMIYDWIKNGGADRREGYQLARRESADALAEQGLEILDDLADERDPTNAEVSVARERSGYRKWLAGKYNRELYGEAPAASLNVSLNVGDLHLDALRVAGSMDLAPAAESGEIQEAEILAIENTPTEGVIEAENVEEVDPVVAELRDA